MIELPLSLSESDLELKIPSLGAATIVILGATGDLAQRKILPALYRLWLDKRIHRNAAILGFARRRLDDEGFRALARNSCEEAFGALAAEWDGFATRLFYLQGDVESCQDYSGLRDFLHAKRGLPNNYLFYLAIAPDQFAQAASGLARVGLGSAGSDPEAILPYRRIVIEKPFGVDRESAHRLNRVLRESFAERDVFRIDHYLFKEPVQNLIYFRFANSIFEPLWNRRYIDQVKIDVLETGGICNKQGCSRGGYYDKAGAAKDMLQNHLIQLLCLTAMEPPATLAPEDIREEKVKVLKAIPDYSAEDLLSRSIRGQYTEGLGPEGRLPDYRREPKVRPDSFTETFVALKLEVDNWRFAGVPFILRTGKALDRRVTEITIRFKRPPETLFERICGERLQANDLTIRIQPDERMILSFNAKARGQNSVQLGELEFGEGRTAPTQGHEAYEKLLADALSGDSTLFIRADEAEEAWRVVDGLERAWTAAPHDRPLPYAAGSQGPVLPSAIFGEW